MKTLKTISYLIIVSLIFLSCMEDKKETEADDYDSETVTEVNEPNYYDNGVLTVITEAMDFQTADTINSGWNRIIYKNKSPEVHFLLLDKLPSDTLGKADIESLMPPFDRGMEFLMENNVDSAMASFGKIPLWFNDVKRFGGTGLISPQREANSVVNLEPGKYMMECYVKMANGEFHTSHGMWKLITVTEESTSMEPPMSTNTTISVSSTDGYSLEGELQSGLNKLKVNFIDQVPYEHFSGHDVNLVKYSESANLDSIVSWLNWMRPTGLRTPAPAGFTFLGGMNNCEGGKTGYFEVELDKGNYIIISETPDSKTKGLYKEITIE